MSQSDGYLITRSGRAICRKRFEKLPSFPFLELPPEIRNIIYRYVVTVPKSQSIAIYDREPTAFRKRTATSSPLHSCTYTSIVGNSWGCKADLEWPALAETTFCLQADRGAAGLALLSVNRQVRMEAMPVFYSQKIFGFRSEFAVVPFIENLSDIARRSVRHIGVCLQFKTDGHQAYREATWTHAFRYIARNMQLKALTIAVIDNTGKLSKRLEDLKRKDLAWGHAVADFTTLNKLDIEVTVRRPGRPQHYRMSGFATHNYHHVLNVNFLAFLKSEMPTD